jgi:phosphotransferase system HPr-like phosphotransfer protein
MTHKNTETVIYINQFEKVAEFINIVNKFTCSIDASQGKYVVDGHSILGIYSLNLMNPVKIVAYGDEAEELIEKLRKEFGT